MNERISAAEFAAFLKGRIGEACIAGAAGEDARRLSDWHYSGQYAGERLDCALRWREGAGRAWDAVGLMEGFILERTGERVSARPRYAYLDWCAPRGCGMIPVSYRVPGAAVFRRAGDIYHAGFLVEPLEDGDWLVAEARSVELGVVAGSLLGGGWNLWGLMSRFLRYPPMEEFSLPLGGRLLGPGCQGGDVRQLQGLLRELGYDAATDGCFGPETERMLRRMQAALDVRVDGLYGEASHAALMACLELREAPMQEIGGVRVRVTAENARVYAAPSSSSPLLTLLRSGEELLSPAENENWRCAMVNGHAAWLRRKDCEVLWNR